MVVKCQRVAGSVGMDVGPANLVSCLGDDRVRVKRGDWLVALVRDFVDVLGRAHRPRSPLTCGLGDGIAVDYLELEGLAIPPAEDGEVVLEGCCLPVVTSLGIPGDESLRCDAANDGLERCQEVGDRFSRGSTGQRERAWPASSRRAAGGRPGALRT